MGFRDHYSRAIHRRLRVSCPMFVAQIAVDRRDHIVQGGPMLWRFKGEHIVALREWVESMGYKLKVEEIV